jgi:hypothetical protein
MLGGHRQVEAVIQGGARGVDQIASEWARFNGIVDMEVKADWEQDGRGAGFIRNVRMVKMATHAIIIWDGKSKGTAHTLNEVEEHELQFVLVVRPPIFVPEPLPIVVD